MIPALDAVTGHLPPGRYRCATTDVKARFVDGLHPRRAVVWNDWQHVTETVQRLTGVCAVWLSGSFVSAKADPDDIDCLYLLPEDKVNQVRLLNPAGALFLSRLAMGRELRNLFNVAVDTYLLSWRPNPKMSARDDLDRQYQRQRGHWDDFWQRLRSGAKGNPPSLSDALPRRGYLEVMVDGFNV